MIENESGENQVAMEDTQEATTLVTEQEAEVEAAPEQEQKNDTVGVVKKSRNSGWHKKINKLEQQNAELLAKLAEISSKPQDDKEPQIDDFETYEAYNSALVNYRVNQAVTERDKKAKKEQEELEFNKQQESIKSLWEKKEESLGELLEEYEELVAQHQTTPFRQELVQATFESDMGPQLRYYLLKNPEELAKINKSPAELSSYAIYRKIAELETKLSEKPAVKVSKSSEPINPVKGTVKTAIKLDNLDTDSYIAQRHPHLFKR